MFVLGSVFRLSCHQLRRSARCNSAAALNNSLICNTVSGSLPAHTSRPRVSLPVDSSDHSHRPAVLAGASAQHGSSLGLAIADIGMDPDLVQTVKAIHACPTQAVFYVAGGGAQVLTWLLTVPGASNTILEGRVPYGGGKSMAELLGREPQKFASVQTAVDLARAAYRQAAHLSAFGTKILGVSCTCALATDRIKKGDHKVCIATHNGAATQAFSVRLSKGARERIAEDAVASRLVLRALAEGCGLGDAARGIELHLLPHENGVAASSGPTEVVQESTQSAGDPLEELAAERVQSVEFSGGQVIMDAPRRGRVYLPGSFNPLHDGHRKLLEAGCSARSMPAEGCFELSISNPDKGTLPLEDVRRRVQQFVDARLPLVITRAPLYTLKARIFAKSTFVIGYDTAIRLVMAKYYGSRERMLLELAGLRHRGCTFLVAGRVDGDGKFLTLADVDVPEEIRDLGLFEAIPEELFRSDISSTQLRESGRGLDSPVH